MKSTGPIRSLPLFVLIAVALSASPTMSYAGLVSVFADNSSIFAINFNNSVTIDQTSTDSNGNKSPFSITYSEDIKHFNFIAVTNPNWTSNFSDKSGSYEVGITSLWKVDFIIDFTDTGGFIFSDPDVGDTLAGSATAQHLVSPMDPFDNPTGDGWTTKIPLQKGSDHIPPPSEPIVIHLHDMNGDAKKHQPIPHFDNYTNGSLSYQTKVGDPALEGNIQSFTLRLEGEHSPTAIPEPPTYILILVGLVGGLVKKFADVIRRRDLALGKKSSPFRR